MPVSILRAAGTLLICLLPLAARGAHGGRLVQPFIPDVPPKASLIRLSAPDADHRVTITGLPGAASPSAWLLPLTLDTGHFVATQAAPDGSFTATIFAPRGTSIMIKIDPAGAVIPQYMSRDTPGPSGDPGNALMPMPGAILRVPDQDPDDPNAFAGAAPVRLGGLPVWTFAGRTSARQLSAGQALSVTGLFTLLSPANFPSGKVTVGLRLERLSTPQGDPVLAQCSFASTIMTPTGLPIERLPDWFNGLDVQKTYDVLAAPNGFQSNIDLSLTLPTDLLPGYYIPYVVFYTEELTQRGEVAAHIDGANRRPLISSVHGPVIRLGNPSPPRLAWTLLNDDLTNGVRGVASVEDRRRFALSTRMRLPTDFTIVPRVAERTGELLRYRLEPYAPTVSLGDQGVAPNPPPIPFRFPSGELRVTVTGPDGSRRSIGPAPFVQSRIRGAGNQKGTPYEFGGHVTDFYQISTMSPEFEVTFAREGLHKIALDGFIEDLWGGRWEIRDTYDVYVGRVLSFEPSVIPGTPLIVGDTLSASGSVSPPLPADVTLTLTHSTGVPDAPPTVRTIRGRANRFGYYRLHEPIALTTPGEYRVDITLQYSDANGSWFGGRTWGNVVAPRKPAITAHGRRGMGDQRTGNAAWFVRKELDPAISDGGLPFPFQSGDVMWQSDSLRSGGVTVLSFEDLTGTLIPLFQPRCSPCPLLHKPPIGEFDARAQVGEMPLFSSRADYVDAHIDPSKIDLWSYGYRFSERPMVSVREVIGEDSLQTTNWYLLDRYGLQAGNGIDGDRPNDFKFQFGGVVVRGSALQQPVYDAYASLWMITAAEDYPNDRIMPPFQGNGGGPSGGPLLTLKGKEIDLFFHPTAVRPGSILHLGEIASFAGQCAPTLSSKVEIVVTSPSGKTRKIQGQADDIGYFYDPSQDFVVGEPGLWKAKVRIVFEGSTSAGAVTEPFPAGDVLGSRDGEFYFYVVDSRAAALDIASVTPAGKFLRPAEGPITFHVRPPAGLTDLQLAYTTIMPGYLLEEGTTTSMTYVYDAPKLASDFPNLDLIDEEGLAGVDVITISLLLSGTGSNGKRLHLARQIVIQGEELQLPDQHPHPRRRAVR